jgi:cytidine deaminase
LAEAKAASLNAYSPYSKFAVGAAILSSDGQIYRGCNVENASFGLTMCAERNAVFRAIEQGMTSIRAMALYTPTSTPTAPCGACRQVLSEFGGNIQIRCYGNGPIITKTSIAEMLPLAFGPSDIK